MALFSDLFKVQHKMDGQLERTNSMPPVSRGPVILEKILQNLETPGKVLVLRLGAR